MEENFKMVAKTLFGFEDLLENALTQLGAQEVKKGVRKYVRCPSKSFFDVIYDRMINIGLLFGLLHSKRCAA